MANPAGLATGIENIAQTNNAYVVASWPANPAQDNVAFYDLQYYKSAGEASGTAATAVSANSLTDSGQAWGVNAFVGFIVKMGGVWGLVQSNTATILTIDSWHNSDGSAAATPALGAYVLYHYNTAHVVASANPSTKISGLPQNVNYTFNVRAVNTIGAASPWSPDKSITTAVDTTPPAVPTGLTVTQSPRGAFLTWNGNTTDGDLQGFQVQVSIGGGAYALLTPGAALITALSYVAPTGTTGGTTLAFEIRAVDWSGNVSAWSAAQSTTTGTLVSGDLATGAVTSAILATGAVTAAAIAAGAVGTAAIANNAITTALLAANAVTQAQIAAGAVGTAQVAANAITSGLLAAGAVNNAALAANAVQQANIASGAVGTAQVAANAITSGLLAAGAVNTAALAANAVQTTNLVPGFQASLANPDPLNVLRNPGFEQGAVYWTTVNGASVITGSSANAHSGNNYYQLTGPAATYVVGFSADEAGNALYFEVAPGATVYYGGWAYRESGTAGLAYVIEITDKDKANPTYAGTTGVTTASWNQVTATYVVPAGRKYLRFYAQVDNTGTGATVGRYDDAFLTIQVPGGAIVANSITAGQIAAGTITATQIAAGTITASQIAASTITGSQIAARTIAAGNIVTGAITANEIAANTITAGQIAAGTITTTQIAAGTIVAGNIASGTITATQIAARTIGASNIVAGAITSNEIAANTITAGNIVSGTITTTQIAAGTITAANIAAGTITATQIAARTIGAGNIVAGAITSNEIAANTIVAANIVAGTITTSLIAAGAITSSLIAAGAVSTDKLTVGAISSNLCANPSFEDVAGGVPLLWTNGFETSGSGCSFASNNAFHQSGSLSGLLTPISAGYGSIASQGIPVTPGDSMYVSAWYVGSASAPNGVYIRAMFCPTGPNFGRFDSGAVYSDILANGAAGTGWQHNYGIVVVPAGCYWMRLALYNYTSTVSVYFDSAEVRVATGGANIINASIVTANIANLAVTNAQINDLVVDKLTAGNLTVAVALTSGKIQTAASGARFVVDSTSIRAYDGSATNYGAPSGAGVTVEISANGAGFFSGTIAAKSVLTGGIQSAAASNVPSIPASFTGFQLDAQNGLRFFVNSVATASWSTSGVLTLAANGGIVTSGGYITSATNVGTGAVGGYKLSGNYLDLYYDSASPTGAGIRWNVGVSGTWSVASSIGIWYTGWTPSTYWPSIASGLAVDDGLQVHRDGTYDTRSNVPVLLGYKRVSPAAASVTFTLPTLNSLDADGPAFRTLKIFIHGKSDAASTWGCDIYAQFNGDTGADYDSHVIVSDDVTAPSSANLPAQTKAIVGHTVGANAAAGTWGYTEITIDIFNFNASGGHAYLFHGGYAENVGPSGHSRIGHGQWRNTAGTLTSVLLYLQAGNWAQDTVMSFWGYM